MKRKIKSSIETKYGEITTHHHEAANPDSKGHVVIAPGYSVEGGAHFGMVAEGLSELGYTVDTYDQPRKGGSDMEALDRQYRVFEEVINSNNPTEKLDLVGYSLGAMTVLEFAKEHPEMVRSITLLQPSGLVKEQSLPELGVRVGKKVANTQLNALRGQSPWNEKSEQESYKPLHKDKESPLALSLRALRTQLIGGWMLAKNPNLALKEANAIREYDIADNLAAIKALGSIPVNIVMSQSDELYSADKVNKNMEDKLEGLVTYSAVTDKKAGHDNPWLRPKTTAQIVANFVEQSQAIMPDKNTLSIPESKLVNNDGDLEGAA